MIVKDRWRFPWSGCARRREGLSLLALGVLEEAERADVEAHLAECAACRVRFRELRAVEGTMRGLGVRGGANDADADAAAIAMSPSAALRDRWERAVRNSAPRWVATGGDCRTAKAGSAGWAGTPAWIGELSWVWGGAAACWLLVACLRGTAPAPVSAPSPSARVAISLREIRVALGRDMSGEQRMEPGRKSESPRRPAPRSEAAGDRRSA